MTTANDESREDWLHDRRITAIPKGEPPIASTSKCPICQHTEAIPTFSVEGIDQPIAVCCECGLGRYLPMLDATQIRAAYPPDYYGYASTKFRGIVEVLVRMVARRHIAFLSAHLPSGAKILDVGCGRGVLLAPLADRGFEVYGVELNESATSGADSRAEIRIAHRLGDAGFEAGSFDQIIIWHVLEHVEDPVHTIEECRRILRPGGRLVVAVPNFSSLQAKWSGPAWFHLDAPRHLYHFPLSALERLLRDHDFEVHSTHHFSLRQNPFGWIQSALNRVTRLPTNGLYRLMYQSGSRGGAPVNASTRLGLWVLLVCSAPVAIGVSVVAALMGSGATVHVLASRGPDA